jgi:hypothetical protein
MKETNDVQWHVTAHFSGIQRILANAKQVLYPPEVFYFYFLEGF